MKLRAIKIWQWLSLALLIGAALVWLRTGGDRFGDDAWRPGIDQAQFESLLRLTKLPHAPQVFRDLTIYPTVNHKTYLSGEYVDLANPDHFRKFEYFADESLNIREWLKAKHPQVHYTYAWWEDTRVQRAFWFGLPLCLIGLICPALMRAFPTRGAVGEAEATSAPEVVETPVVVSVNEPATTEQVAEPILQAAPVLSSQPMEPVPAARPEEEKDYKGEYYPVARASLAVRSTPGPPPV